MSALYHHMEITMVNISMNKGKSDYKTMHIITIPINFAKPTDILAINSRFQYNILNIP